MELRRFVEACGREHGLVEGEEIEALLVVGVEMVVPEQRRLLLELPPGVHRVHQIERLQLLDGVGGHQRRQARVEIGVCGFVDRGGVQLLVQVAAEAECPEPVARLLVPAVPQPIERVIPHDGVARTPEHAWAAARVEPGRPLSVGGRLRRHQIEEPLSGGRMGRAGERRGGQLDAMAQGARLRAEPGEVAAIDVVRVGPRRRVPREGRRLVHPVAGHLSRRGREERAGSKSRGQQGEERGDGADEVEKRGGPRPFHGVPSC